MLRKYEVRGKMAGYSARGPDGGTSAGRPSIIALAGFCPGQLTIGRALDYTTQ